MAKQVRSGKPVVGGEELSATLESERFTRLAGNVAALLEELILASHELDQRSRVLRKKVLVDLRGVLAEIGQANHGIVLTRLGFEVQHIVDAKGSPKITVTGGTNGCVGRPGGGINATEGGITVGACAVVDGGKPVGGGVQGSVSY